MTEIGYGRNLGRVGYRPIRMTWRIITLAIAATFVVSACGSPDGAVESDDASADTTSTQPTTTAPQTVDDGSGGPSEGTEPNGDWILVSGVQVVDGYPISLTINELEFGGRAACNQYGGTILIGDDVWELSEMFMTEMACEPAVMDAEQAYLSAMNEVDGWYVTDGALTLTGPDPELVFEPAPEVPTEALVGTEWVLESVIQDDAASSTVGDPATLLLSDDGTLIGSTGCRTLTGTWVEADGQIFFPDFAADGECSDEVSRQDGIVVTVLGDGFRATIDGDVLTLTSMGDEGLVYRSS